VWEERYDDVAERAWYYNRKTGESQLIKPQELWDYEEKKNKVMKRRYEELTLSPEELFEVRLKDWDEYWDEEYYSKYWHNRETNETSWIDPATLRPLPK
jgi:hypothetical protein